MTMVKTTLTSRTETRLATSTTITIDYYPRCIVCHRVMATMLTRPWSMMCAHHSCKKMNYGNTETK